jgi:hypothetical protein
MYEVDVTGETTGMVLQTMVEEVNWLVTAVEVVTTEVEVLVLVTVRGLVNLVLRTMSRKIYLPT